MSKNKTSYLKTFFPLIFVISIVALIAAIMLLGEFIEYIKDKPLEFEPIDDYVVDSENDLTYRPCNKAVVAISLGDKCFAEAGDASFYSIDFMNSDEYIALSRSEGGTVYYSDKVKDVSFETFSPIAARIYATSVFSGAPLDYFVAAQEYLESNSGNVTDDTEYTNAVYDCVINGDSVAIPSSLDDSATLYLLMLSAEYPGLAYQITFMKDKNGIAYLYDPATQKCVLCSDALTVRLS